MKPEKTRRCRLLPFAVVFGTLGAVGCGTATRSDPAPDSVASIRQAEGEQCEQICGDSASYPYKVSILPETGSGYRCLPWALQRVAKMKCECNCGGPYSHYGAVPPASTGTWVATSAEVDAVVYATSSKDHWGRVSAVNPTRIDHHNCNDSGGTVYGDTLTNFLACAGPNPTVSYWKLTSCGGTCTPATCSSLGKQCGQWPDGCGGNLNCGSCQTGYACDANGQCVCQPKTCSGDYPGECGQRSDGCGGTLYCSCAPDYCCMSYGMCKRNYSGCEIEP